MRGDPRAAAFWLGAVAFSGAAVAAEQPLVCFGNEPSWSVDLTESGTARFATPDADPLVYRGKATRLDFLRETLWRGTSGAGRDLVVWMQDKACSDGMSDTSHPVTARVSLADGRFLAGCCRLAAATTAATPSGSVEGVEWRLVYLPGNATGGLEQLSRPITVRFEEGRARGFSGCNTFTGGYRLEGDRLTLTQLAATMMACPGPAMPIENTFHKAFSGTMRYTLEGDRLTLVGASGETFRFERQPPPRLAGVDWKVTSFNNNRHAVVGVTGDAAITLSFRDGQVSGSAGCNTFQAPYSSDGNRVQIGPAVTTRRACAESLMTQEQEFLAALASATTWSIDGNVLDMHRADEERALWAVAQ
ncbi:MAG: META domain-containing protein [Gammaproteobacteria bacterium]|nr:MAG: META domain-containing protein [Gammaproteobacteria bacterium]